MGLLFILVFIIACAPFEVVVSSSPSFVISENGTTFLKDGEPFRIISGSVHYFRMHPDLYQDRLYKAYMGGLNTVQTYVPWNLHNPQPGVFNFSTLVKFLDTAKEQGLLVTLRAGPYSCGEWEFGGFPYWILQQSPDVTLRSSDPLFLNAVYEWWSQLLPVISPYLYSNGGNIVLVQLENEYGSYGNDKDYLQSLLVILRKFLGDDVIIHSTDGAWALMLLNSYIPGVYQTVDFGPGNAPASAFESQHEYNKNGPFMNSEYYTGWLTHWGDSQMATTNTTIVTKWLNEILAYNGSSVNMYMYYGGTNFGFMNGANGGFTSYSPQITSYDYDAPLNEAGDPTEKYFAIRDVISKYAPVPSGSLPTPSTKGDYGTIPITEQVSLFAPGVLEPPFTTPIVTSSTYNFERLGLDYGFVLYHTDLARLGNQSSQLQLTPRDRAWVFLDGTYIGLVYRDVNTTLTLPPPLSTNVSALDILVENMGRINFGPAMFDPKGLGPGVLCEGMYVFGWTAYPLPLTDLSSLNFQARYSGSGPSFFRGTFNIQGTPMDTYFNMQGWTKGNVFINGYNLGRYWWIGPQYSLYVPAPLLSTGENEVIIFELEGTQSTSILSQTAPVYNNSLTW